MQPLIALDQLINTCIWIEGDGFGMADETMSARAWRLSARYKGAGRARRIIDLIFFWQKNHCYQAWTSEILRKQLPNDYKG